MKRMTFFIFLIGSIVGIQMYGAPAVSFPVGSYNKSCSNCSVETKDNGEVLFHCICDGKRSTINRYQCENDDIWNKNGHLTCAKDKALPAGSYKESCHDCKYIGPDTIQCCCEPAYKEECRMTSLQFSTCKTQGTIANVVGGLQCEGQENWMDR